MTARIVLATLFVLSAVACGGSATPQSQKSAQTPSAAIDVVHVVQQPMDVTLSMPGELEAYQTVAIYPRVTGFVKTITVDRGSRVRAGQIIATLEAPELAAQRAEAQSKLQSAAAQLSAAKAKADADASTYDKSPVQIPNARHLPPEALAQGAAPLTIDPMRMVVAYCS